MTDELPFKASAGDNERTLPTGFIALCIVAFLASAWATIHFCRSMCCEMEMPGGWTMSMMWMRMPGKTWFVSAASFLLMWLAMKAAMMLPSASTTFLKTKRRSTSLSAVAAGYFSVWLVVGVGLYLLGVAFAAAAMRWESFSRAVPMLSDVALIIAGGVQFTRWKMASLLRCRSSSGCVSSSERDTGFRLGCRQGADCCICCAAPTMALIVLGMMNPFVVVGVAAIVAAEKLLPRPEIIARFVGVAAVVVGALMIVQRFC